MFREVGLQQFERLRRGVGALDQRAGEVVAHEVVREVARDQCGLRRALLRKMERALAAAPESVLEPVPEPVTDTAQPATDAVKQRVPTTI